MGKTCENCNYEHVPNTIEPCESCLDIDINADGWEPKPEQEGCSASCTTCAAVYLDGTIEGGCKHG